MTWPDRDALARRPHGTRHRYLSGCKCLPCRTANSCYAQERAAAIRQGDWNGIVPATRARAHIKRLSKQGVGRKAVAAASGISATIIGEVAAGRKKNIRARTERKILDCDRSIIADGALVSANGTRRLIDRLVVEGFTKARLARLLGYRTPALQFAKRRRVIARTASRVERLYERLTA